jgi:hypothetical protein
LGVSDDVDRGDLTTAATDEELEVLVQTVGPLYPAINAYLDKPVMPTTLCPTGTWPKRRWRRGSSWTVELPRVLLPGDWEHPSPGLLDEVLDRRGE